MSRRKGGTPRMTQITDAISGEMFDVPADALEAVTASLMPAIIRHGCVSLQIGTPRPRAGAERPLNLIGGSGRAGDARALPSSLSLPPNRTFTCPHLSIGNAASASCGICGPLPAVA